MSFSATIVKTMDGPRNVVYRLTGKSDGTGQEVNALKVDVSSLSPPCGSVRMMRISGEVQGGSVELIWDAVSPVRFAELSGQVLLDYMRVGGEANKTTGKTGDVMLSTVGFTAGSVYDLLLEMVKKQ